MDTIIGDHRSVLDDNSGKHKVAEKRTEVLPPTSHGARPNRTRTSKATSHQSWIDVVKSRPLKGLKGAHKSLLKR
jgi:hypothetical protein